MDIAKFISFRFKFFRFVSVFRTFFVSIFVSINGIKIFPLVHISIFFKVNHTDVKCNCRSSSVSWSYSGYLLVIKS